jgi:hypothetical protein
MPFTLSLRTCVRSVSAGDGWYSTAWIITCFSDVEPWLCRVNALRQISGGARLALSMGHELVVGKE